MTTLSSQFDQDTRKRTGAKIVKRNTFARDENGEIVIRLHKTDIVRKNPKTGRVVLNSDGWKTVTTKDRMNDHLPEPFWLEQESGQWYIGKGWRDENRIPYFDGICIPDDYDKPKHKGEAAANKEKKLRAQIRKFVCDVSLKGPFPEPSNDDCWYCFMKTQDGKSLGEAAGDVDHIRSHIKERYLHGSLIVNSLIWAGYRNPGVIYQMKLGATIRRALKRYLYRQCGLVA